MTEESRAARRPLVEHVEREEFELACIREFSHSGHYLGASVSRAERCERIRSAIMREQKADLRWPGSDMTYASAFAQAYRQPLETNDARSAKSQHWGRSAIPEPFDDDEEESERSSDM